MISAAGTFELSFSKAVVVSPFSKGVAFNNNIFLVASSRAARPHPNTFSIQSYRGGSICSERERDACPLARRPHVGLHV
jgi:hypothetical protein